MVARPLVRHKVSWAAALNSLFLLTIGIQGFHVIEHIVVVVQFTALGAGLHEAHGLLGARVDFEWLHFWYNLTFLGAMLLLLLYGRSAGGGRLASVGTALLTVSVGVQTYHVGEHVLRMVEYLSTGCAPCEGLVGQAVPFVWPHLLFGLFGYVGFVTFYIAHGLYPRRGLWRPAGG